MEKPRIVQKIIFPDGDEGYAHYDLPGKELIVRKGVEEPMWDTSREDTFEVPFVGISERMEEAYIESSMDLYSPESQN